MTVRNLLDREGLAVPSRATIAVGQLQVGEEGYCSLEAVYVAPTSPKAPDEGRDVAATALFLLPDSEIYSEPSPLAKMHIRRLEEGYAVHLPAGEFPSRYRRSPAPDSLPVIATE